MCSSRRWIKIEVFFNGGAREVGKSSVNINSDGLSLVLDAGIKLDEPPTYPIEPDSVDALFLSHAHLDHCGNIPAWHRKHKFPVYMTEGSMQLSHMLQLDSLKIDLLKGYDPRYSEMDVERLGAAEIPVKYNRQMRFKDIPFEFFDAGHIPGSAGILLEIEGKKVFYTGDTNVNHTRLLNPAQYPDDVDILITESTYGARLHPERKQVEDEFLDEVKSTIDRGGHVLVPAFAIGRAQELLLLLKDLDLPVHMDGMAKKASGMMLSTPEFLRDPDLLMQCLDEAVFMEGRRHRRKILAEGPSIIVTTAGMLAGGPVLDYLSMLHKDANSSILLTGYQVEDCNGRLLLDEGYIVDEQTGKKFTVLMNTRQFDFSAHSDREDLSRMVDGMSPEHVVLMHGDEEAIDCLTGDLSEYKVHAPGFGEKLVF